MSGASSMSVSNGMDPLSKKKRRIYLSIFGLCFLISIPVLIFYATGYRITSALDLIRTGGLHISIPISESTVFLEDKKVKQSGVFSKNVFVQNLRPDVYVIRVEKEGYQTWVKDLQVFPQTVTEGYPFLLKKKAVLAPINQFPVSEVVPSNATGTKIKTATSTAKQTTEYTEVKKLFAPIPATSTASTTQFEKLRRKILIENKKGVLHVSWTGEVDAAPHYFCENEICKKEILITGDGAVQTFDFFPGRDDLMVFSTITGIYVSEIDDRSKQNVHILIMGKNLDFRVENSDVVFIKKDGAYFSISY